MQMYILPRVFYLKVITDIESACTFARAKRERVVHSELKKVNRRHDTAPQVKSLEIFATANSQNEKLCGAKLDSYRKNLPKTIRVLTSRFRKNMSETLTV